MVITIANNLSPLKVDCSKNLSYTSTIQLVFLDFCNWLKCLKDTQKQSMQCTSAYLSLCNSIQPIQPNKVNNER